MGLFIAKAYPAAWKKRRNGFFAWLAKFQNVLLTRGVLGRKQDAKAFASTCRKKKKRGKNRRPR